METVTTSTSQSPTFCVSAPRDQLPLELAWSVRDNGQDKAILLYWHVLHGFHDTESLNGQVRVLSKGHTLPFATSLLGTCACSKPPSRLMHTSLARPASHAEPSCRLHLLVVCCIHGKSASTRTRIALMIARISPAPLIRKTMARAYVAHLVRRHAGMHVLKALGRSCRAIALLHQTLQKIVVHGHLRRSRVLRRLPLNSSASCCSMCCRLTSCPCPCGRAGCRRTCCRGNNVVSRGRMITAALTPRTRLRRPGR